MTTTSMHYPDVDRPQRWQDRAACSHVNSALFMPDKDDIDTIYQAKRVCARCPVRRECLVEAVQSRDKVSIRGGLTPGERRTMLRRDIQIDGALQQLGLTIKRPHIRKRETIIP